MMCPHKLHTTIAKDNLPSLFFFAILWTIGSAVADDKIVVGGIVASSSGPRVVLKTGFEVSSGSGQGNWSGIHV